MKSITLAALAVAFGLALTAGGCREQSQQQAGTGGRPAAAVELAEAPAFTLSDTHGQSHSLADFRGKWVVLEWINHGCPFVVKHYNGKKMQQLQKDYTARDVIWLSIASSAPGQQGHLTAEQWNEVNKEKQANPTAVLLDPDGTAGRAYGATRTPEMVIINPQGRIVYRGAIDDKPTTNLADLETANNYVVKVLDAVLAGEPAPIAQTDPYGCTVKYPKP